jgi:hypothetical protein
MNGSRSTLALFAITTACNVSAAGTPTPPIDAGKADSGAAGCDRGTVVLLTDYMSTQIALASPDGTPLSPSFLSTASTKTSGLAYALSGDVVLPGARPPSGRAVLLDRFGTNVVTWADPTSNAIVQLPVGTGFESNPQDYLELEDGRAYVTRYGVNHMPGAQPFDSGSDVLVIDTRQMPTPVITKSIPAPVEDGLPPGPSAMARVGNTILVVLQRISEDFTTVGEGAIIGIQNDAVAWETHVGGLKNCGRPVLSPSGKTLALACEGQLAMDGSVMDLSASAIALFDVTTSPPTPMQRFAIADQLGAPSQNNVAWVSDTMLLGKTQTASGGATNNQAFTLDVTTGKASVILSAGTDAQGKGKGAVYGDVRCSPGCANVCLLADSDVGKLRRWNITANGLDSPTAITVDSTTGLPPVSLGAY